MSTEGTSMEPPFEVEELGRFSVEFNRESDRVRCWSRLVAASRLDEVLKGLLLATAAWRSARGLP
jgi:hypothetical protein